MREALALFAARPDRLIERTADGGIELARADRPGVLRLSGALVRSLLARGVLAAERDGRLRPQPEAASLLARMTPGPDPYRAQHATLVAAGGENGGDRPPILRNADESPVATLAQKRAGRPPYLGSAAVAAAERLRADFERAQLQPRMTASWSATVTSGRRTGGRGGTADLTDASLAARIRVDEAVAAVGPEFAGVLLDICCFLKGLETVEREREWPARSAKLVLKLALSALSRHYGLCEAAEGPQRSKGVRHWGAADYRPTIA
nr:DUF6456 domain-containing protein [Propylenella binzhouense]